MQIYDIKVNHLAEPLGFMMADTPVLSYKVKGTRGVRQKSVRLRAADNADMHNPIYDSGHLVETWPVYPLTHQLVPRTRYYVQVEVITDAGEYGTAQTFFETGKMNETWRGEWITSVQAADNTVPVLGRAFAVNKPLRRARLYVGCAGLYQMTLNGGKVGNEHLTPYCNDYSSWMQVITHDVTDQVMPGENLLEATLAGGWYEGRFALADRRQIYGDTLALIAELHIDYADGSSELICTGEDWYSRKSVYQCAELYDGAVLDFRRDTCTHFGTKVVAMDKRLLTDRLSLPVVEKMTLPVQSSFTTPKGEAVLDFGQNMVGSLRVDTSSFHGKDFTLRFFEVLDEDGNVYLDNLRSAKQAFVYKTDGEVRLVQPQFTYYGFRYVWVNGLDADVDTSAFTGVVLYSDMAQTGSITTSDQLVNRLFLNALWGQRGNFVDVPTDCPQRDERLGWTGDAQVFCGTASYNMDTAAFFTKYMYDMWQEQKKAGGAVPHFVPSFADKGEANPTVSQGSAAWGDAATIIPWVNYLHCGDKELLARQYPSMKAWVEYIRSQDTESQGLWLSGFHFGDWLALDNPDKNSSFGATPSEMVASAYYLYSTQLTAKAAAVLGKAEDAKVYKELAERIRKAIQREFVTPSGRIASDTQTANVISLFMGFAIDSKRAATDLDKKLRTNSGHLRTGFVGTAYLCRVLSDNGLNHSAYSLLMNRDYPGWLYEVERGATTIWERWNSIKQDGSLGDASMNSYNHYAYGAVVEWLYRNVAGLQPDEAGPGFKHVRLAPQPDPQLEWVKAAYDSPCGLYRSEWRIMGDELHFEFEIPFGGEASLYLPCAPKEIMMNGLQVRYEDGMPLFMGEHQVVYTCIV
ncbi:MAG: glycoside hydrolase family 78 protein [Clostridiales bacterium]|jgi:alpha-L-rhamnosidase|nr:glycoside hydrolase family 78 protein [Clostridiales bacterium]